MHFAVNTIGRFAGFDEEDVYLRRLVTTMRDIQESAHFTILADRTNYHEFDGWDRILIGPDHETRGHDGPVSKSVDRAAKGCGASIVFSPLATASMAGSFPCVPYVLDVEQVQREREHGGRRGSARFKDMKKVCARAVCILAPSEYMRKRLLEVFAVPLNRCVVAPPGADKSFEEPQPSLTEPPYIVAGGDLSARGNILNLRSAFRKVAEDLPHNLVIMGRPTPDEPEDWGPRVMRVHQCPANVRAGLYQKSSAFVSTSLNEAAVITLLEAVRAGVRPIIARMGGVEELAGTVPVYYNRDSEASLVAAIKRVLQESDKERTSGISFGKQRVAEYTWDKPAWKALRAFKRQP
jgi:glycosyltransferase involved in cell wall biosynthesis